MKTILMKKIIFLYFLFISVFPALGQEGFVFQENAGKAVIPFKFINNLIFIPIKVNGVELNFLLDSGVDETILFSMEDKKEVLFFNVEKVALRGLGSEDAVEGLKSRNNILEVQGLKAKDQILYIILDQSFNLSYHVGIPVNGIIGYHFMRNNLIEINYEKKVLTVHSDTGKIRKKIEKKFETIPVAIEAKKPYVNGKVIINNVEIPVKLLMDIGNSDAVWLFQNISKIPVPEKNFEDYLGKGFSGDVVGKRAQIEKAVISKFEFFNPVVAFPDSISIKNVKMVKDRAGSIGSEILKRFHIVFDYPNQEVFLRKNKDFDSPFSYNKSGIELEHYGMQWIPETFPLETIPLSGEVYINDFKYKVVLKPVYRVANVREKSITAVSGIEKGDVLVSINKVPAYRYSLEEINSIFRSDKEIWITLEVQRNDQLLKFRFQLKSEL